MDKKRKIIIPIIPTFLLILGIAIILNPPVYVKDIETPNGKAHVEIKLSAYLYRYLFAPITEQYKLVSATDEEVINVFRDIQQITNQYLNTSLEFMTLYNKLSEKYNIISICVETSQNRFQCATYILYPNFVVMTYDVSTTYKIILFKREKDEISLIPKSFYEIYTQYKNADFKGALESLAKLYNEGKIRFYNWDIKDLLETLASRSR